MFRVAEKWLLITVFIFLRFFFYDGLEICGIIADTNLIMVAEHVIGVNGFA